MVKMMVIVMLVMVRLTDCKVCYGEDNGDRLVIVRMMAMKR